MPQELGLISDAPLSIPALLLNLAIGAVLALLLRWHFLRFGSTLSNREEFAQVFPFVLMTTVLIISVVKSSLALSLGLVGALSIVRFRTPIKEPEELAYLFIAIAMGLGLGASQTIPTLIAGPAILVVMAVLQWRGQTHHSKNLYLSVNWNSESQPSADRCLDELNEIIMKHAKRCDLRRLDMREQVIEVTYFVDMAGTKQLSAMNNELQRTFPGVGINFLDQSRLPSL